MQKNADIKTVNLRLAVLGTALEALARSLPPAEAARASAAFCEHARSMVDNQRLTERGEDPILGDVARILDALRRPETLPGHAGTSAH